MSTLSTSCDFLKEQNRRRGAAAAMDSDMEDCQPTRGEDEAMDHGDENGIEEEEEADTRLDNVRRGVRDDTATRREPTKGRDQDRGPRTIHQSTRMQTDWPMLCEELYTNANEYTHPTYQGRSALSLMPGTSPSANNIPSSRTESEARAE
ncbi:hypothetical protein K438DRAFT_2011440, partial [Mycena galopus ATCC 62051]